MMPSHRDTEAVARDARPPALLVRLMNPVMRILLRTQLGRAVRPFALVEFAGRRTGRRFRVPVGWHEIDGERIVCTPAPWRVNFRDGIPATVWYQGRRHRLTGTLDDEPAHVAAALQSLARHRGSLRSVGVDVPPEHTMTTADVRAVNRAIIRFTGPRSTPRAAG